MVADGVSTSEDTGTTSQRGLATDGRRGSAERIARRRAGRGARRRRTTIKTMTKRRKETRAGQEAAKPPVSRYKQSQFPASVRAGGKDFACTTTKRQYSVPEQGQRTSEREAPALAAGETARRDEETPRRTVEEEATGGRSRMRNRARSTTFVPRDLPRYFSIKLLGTQRRAAPPSKLLPPSKDQRGKRWTVSKYNDRSVPRFQRAVKYIFSGTPSHVALQLCAIPYSSDMPVPGNRARDYREQHPSRPQPPGRSVARG